MDTLTGSGNLEEEVMKKREEKEEEVIIREPPIKLILQSSEDCFHQVVKFTRRAPRRKGMEHYEPKTLTALSSEKEDIQTVPVNKINERGTKLDADLRGQSECYASDDQTCLKLNDVSSNSYSVECDTAEWDSLDRESICAEVSRETHENMVEDSNLLQCGRAKAHLKIGSTQMDKELKPFVLNFVVLILEIRQIFS